MMFTFQKSLLQIFNLNMKMQICLIYTILATPATFLLQDKLEKDLH